MFVARNLRFTPLLLTALAAALLAVPDISEAGGLPPVEQQIVYTCSAGGPGSNSEICGVQPDGTGFTNITNDPQGDTGPEISPNGQHIAYRHAITEIWVMDPDGGNRRMVTDVISAFGEPTWSPDSTQLATSCNNPDDITTSGFCTIDVATGEVDFIKELDFYTVEDLAWSPLGNMLLYTEEKLAEGIDLYVLNMSSGSITQITDSPDDSEYGTWKPDGTQIAFVGHPIPADGDDDPFPNLYSIDPDGDDRDLLYDPESLSTSHSAPAYSPDGARLAWFCDDGDVGESFMCVNNSQTGALIDHYQEGANGLVVGSDPDWGYTSGPLFLDLNCDGFTDEVDAQLLLDHIAETQTLDEAPCLAIGSGTSLGGAPYVWGDANCDDTITPYDALLILLWRMGFPQVFAACPLPGQLADITIPN